MRKTFLVGLVSIMMLICVSQNTKAENKELSMLESALMPVEISSDEADIPWGELDFDDIYENLNPEEYYINDAGLHWRTDSKMENLGSDKDGERGCYAPYGFSIVGGSHFAYWFSWRPPSYNAYMWWQPIYASPYGNNGILVQKRDICFYCACNPWCAKSGIRICSK